MAATNICNIRMWQFSAMGRRNRKIQCVMDSNKEKLWQVQFSLSEIFQTACGKPHEKGRTCVCI